MNKPTLWMMCGLPCSGKSTESQRLAIIHNANIHSSDAIREELTGDINNQENNALVFQTLHQRIKDDLRNGKNCIYDACCVHYKERKAFLQELKSITCEKVCVLMATPYEVCLERNTNRDRKIPEHVIKRMYMAFDPPYWYEGWDNIEISYGTNRASFGTPFAWCRSVAQYNQHNSHHTLSLGEHCILVYKYIKELYPANCDKDIVMRVAAMLHDCGKCFTQTFVNGKGDTTTDAHYYGHEHTSSYDCLFFGMSCNPLDVAIRTRWHMQPYFWERDNNEKLHNKYRNLWGEELYSDIMKLHEADLAAH
jgi:predicted kinase